MQGKYQDALEPLSRCVQLAPEDAQAYNNLGSVLLELNRFDEAEINIRQALKLHPDYAPAHTNLGTALQELGRLDEAVESYRKALALNPDYALAHNNLGNVFRTKGDFARAKECYLHALALNPNLPQTNLNLGLILEKQPGEKAEAMKYYHKALTLDPGLAEAHQHYGNILALNGKIEGLEHLEKANQLKPDLEFLQQQLGASYLQFGKKNEATIWLKIALQKNPGDVDAQYYLSLAEGRLPARETRTKYVKNLFDNYSSNFEKHLVENLEYRVPQVAREMIEEIYGKNIRFQNMADLGCGTGLSGIAFRDCTEHIVGVDLSQKMLDIATEKGVYDMLLQGEITQVLDELDQEFDFFLATEVTIYLQKLDNLFASIRKRAASGALFVFSTEKFDGDGFAVNEQTGRTAHSAEYIHTLADKFNFQIIKDSRIPLRKDRESWAQGELYILQCLK
jgi:predicted TPR repeat methyltransferase